MTPLLLIRHGPTEWTADGRIQGRQDPPLSPAGRKAVRSWRLPQEVTGPEAGRWVWLTSPLLRARETATLLQPETARCTLRIEPTLAEMHWGEWEGRRLTELRDAGGAAVADAEAQGLDFRPPGGESPREVQVRIFELLIALTTVYRPAVAVTHKGVIRAIYALATGWDLTGPPPHKLREACAHRFRLESGGVPHVDRLNIPLQP